VITATFPGATIAAAPAVAGARTIEGVAVPYGVPGRVSTGDVVVFERGSLDASARPIALRDHDRSRPIGVVVDAADRGDAMTATVRVSRTAEGDDALVLAGDGALPAFSVGADPTDWRTDAEGVMHVYAADWLELSLLTFGAYTGARVATVTATRGAPMTDTVTVADTPTDPDVDDPTQPNPAPPDPDDDDDATVDDAVLEAITAGAAPRPLPVLGGAPNRAARRARPPARHPYADVSLAQFSRVLQASRGGDPRAAVAAQRMLTAPGMSVSAINAALADVTLVGTDNVGAGYRPGYQAELVEIVSHGSPVVDILRQGNLERGDYPNKTFNQWTKLPQVALQTAEKAQINSTPVSIGAVSVPVQTWATGNDLSQQLLDFGSPSFVEDYIRAAGVDYADVIETYAVTALLAAATPATVAAGDGFLTVFAALLGAIDPTKVPAGGLFLAVSWDVWAQIMTVTTNDGPAFWSGNVSLGSMLPSTNMGGLTVVYSPALPAATYLLGLRNAATWYDLPGTPFTLRAVNVGQLGLDVGVYGYGAVGIQFPYALVKATVPPAGP
jgi:HK97 family phage prohead protease